MKKLFLLALPVALTACSTQPLPPIYVSFGSAEHNIQDELTTSRVNRIKITDNRDDKDDIGQYGSQIIYAKNLQPWFKRQLGGMLISACPTKQPLMLRVRMKKVYLDTNNEELTAAIAYQVKFYKHGKVVGGRDYRGQITQIDWSGPNRNIKTMLVKTLHQTRRALRKDVCSV